VVLSAGTTIFRSLKSLALCLGWAAAVHCAYDSACWAQPAIEPLRCCWPRRRRDHVWRAWTVRCPSVVAGLVDVPVNRLPYIDRLRARRGLGSAR